MVADVIPPLIDLIDLLFVPLSEIFQASDQLMGADLWFVVMSELIDLQVLGVPSLPHTEAL